ncbi:hypothetical protein [Oleisolibacter albus]|uniref:hypothetical protein n=1 Tax=Oleisolibacter albus TaxID=2171757 RepID=UPI0012D81A36|nr:hypothetical protein [Oleisolibacter albus]
MFCIVCPGYVKRLPWHGQSMEHLLVRRHPCALSLEPLTLMGLAPWSEQPARVFEE